MDIETILIVWLVALLALAAFAWLVWRSTSPAGRALAERIAKLPWRSKLRLAGAILRDGRVPLGARALLLGMALYLALPVDLIPDFIPVLGQLDDVIVMALGAGLLLRSTPLAVLDEHVTRLEARERRPAQA
jgi:uncharacterized membrane protein YkvA (DUF1232 family)